MRELYRKSPQEIIWDEIKEQFLIVTGFQIVFLIFVLLRYSNKSDLYSLFIIILAAIIPGLIFGFLFLLDVCVMFFRGLKTEKHTVSRKYIGTSKYDSGLRIKFVNLKKSFRISEGIYGQLTIGDSCSISYIEGVWTLYLVELTTDSEEILETFSDVALNEEIHFDELKECLGIKFQFTSNLLRSYIDECVKKYFLDIGYSKTSDHCYQRGKFTNISVDKMEQWLTKVTVNAGWFDLFQGKTFVDYHIYIGKTPITRDVIDFWLILTEFVGSRIPASGRSNQQIVQPTGMILVTIEISKTR